MTYCDKSVLSPECGNKICSKCYPPTEQLKLQQRYDLLEKEFTENGFTEQQANYLIHLLNEYIPLY